MGISGLLSETSNRTDFFHMHWVTLWIKVTNLRENCSIEVTSDFKLYKASIKTTQNWRSFKAKMRAYAKPRTPSPLQAFGRTPSPHSCVRTITMTPLLDLCSTQAHPSCWQGHPHSSPAPNPHSNLFHSPLCKRPVQCRHGWSSGW